MSERRAGRGRGRGGQGRAAAAGAGPGVMGGRCSAAPAPGRPGAAGPLSQGPIPGAAAWGCRVRAVPRSHPPRHACPSRCPSAGDGGAAAGAGQRALPGGGPRRGPRRLHAGTEPLRRRTGASRAAPQPGRLLPEAGENGAGDSPRGSCGNLPGCPGLLGLCCWRLPRPICLRRLRWEALSVPGQGAVGPVFPPCAFSSVPARCLTSWVDCRGQGRALPSLPGLCVCTGAVPQAVTASLISCCGTVSEARGNTRNFRGSSRPGALEKYWGP